MKRLADKLHKKQSDPSSFRFLRIGLLTEFRGFRLTFRSWILMLASCSAWACWIPATTAWKEGNNKSLVMCTGFKVIHSARLYIKSSMLLQHFCNDGRLAHLVHHHLGRGQHVVEGFGAVEPWVSQNSLNSQPLLGFHLQQPAGSRWREEGVEMTENGWMNV